MIRLYPMNYEDDPICKRCKICDGTTKYVDWNVGNDDFFLCVKCNYALIKRIQVWLKGKGPP